MENEQHPDPPLPSPHSDMESASQHGSNPGSGDSDAHQAQNARTRTSTLPWTSNLAPFSSVLQRLFNPLLPGRRSRSMSSPALTDTTSTLTENGTDRSRPRADSSAQPSPSILPRAGRSYAATVEDVLEAEHTSSQPIVDTLAQSSANANVEPREDERQARSSSSSTQQHHSPASDFNSLPSQSTPPPDGVPFVSPHGHIILLPPGTTSLPISEDGRILSEHWYLGRVPPAPEPPAVEQFADMHDGPFDFYADIMSSVLSGFRLEGHPFFFLRTGTYPDGLPIYRAVSERELMGMMMHFAYEAANQAKSRGLSESQMKRLPYVLIKGPGAKSETCSICFEQPTENVDPRDLLEDGPKGRLVDAAVFRGMGGCEHYFCDGCTVQWMKDHLTCPLCRTQVKIARKVPSHPLDEAKATKNRTRVVSCELAINGLCSHHEEDTAKPIISKHAGVLPRKPGAPLVKVIWKNECGETFQPDLSDSCCAPGDKRKRSRSLEKQQKAAKAVAAATATAPVLSSTTTAESSFEDGDMITLNGDDRETKQETDAVLTLPECHHRFHRSCLVTSIRASGRYLTNANLTPGASTTLRCPRCRILQDAILSPCTGTPGLATSSTVSVVPEFTIG